MPPLVDNLGARLATILLAGFAALQLVIVALVAWPVDGRSPLFELPLPEETAAMVRALEATPPAARPLVVKALNTSTVTVRLADAFPPQGPGQRESPAFERMFADYSPALAGRPFRVDRRLRPGRRLVGLLVGHPQAPLRLSVALRGGGVLVIERRAPLAVRTYIARAALMGGSVALTLALVLGLAVRQTTRPVSELARAVRRFTPEAEPHPLPETGPREIRDLAAAFNEMRGRIRALVGDRTRILAAVAHDLRTYLTRLRLRAEFIDDPDQRARASRDLDEMSALLDDTLLFAKDAAAPGPAAEPFDAAEEVAAFIAVRRELGEPVEDRPGPAGGPTVVRCSRMALRRILANLADNAIRYGEAARLSVRAESGGVEIRVDDHGPGIPPAAIARITEPFERLEASRGRATGGSGLGLAIVRALAEGQGGRLTLVNRKVGGLSARVWLPAAGAAKQGEGE